jgi:hypothetical protein
MSQLTKDLRELFSTTEAATLRGVVTLLRDVPLLLDAYDELVLAILKHSEVYGRWVAHGGMGMTFGELDATYEDLITLLTKLGEET